MCVCVSVSMMGLLNPGFMTSKSLLYREPRSLPSSPESFHVNLGMYKLATDALLSIQATPASAFLDSTSSYSYFPVLQKLRLDSWAHSNGICKKRGEAVPTAEGSSKTDTSKSNNSKYKHKVLSWFLGFAFPFIPLTDMF